MKNFISEYRKAKGLTQPQLADLAKLPNYTVVQRYEHGRALPAVDTALRIARALDTTVEQLFVLEDEE